MIELTRYVLAAIVAQTHLWPRGADWMGQIAVFTFYTLSGYLITRVLNTRYGFTWRGTGAFALNRVLRLWPAYVAIMALVLLALQALPLDRFFPLIRTPKSALEIVTNTIVIGQVTFDYRQWYPLAKPLVTSWSLSIEVCCYLLLALYFAGSSLRLSAFIVVGVVAMAISTGWCAASDNPGFYGAYCFQNRYGVIQAGFVPFAFGGIYYFHRERLAAWIDKRRRIVAIALICASLTMFAGPWLTATVGPFLGIPMTYLLLTAARDYRPTPIQDFFGRASYHLFIAHLPIAAVLAVGFHVRGVLIYVATIVIALGLSVALVPMERCLNGVRRRVATMAEHSN